MKRLKAFSIFALSAAILCSCGAARNADLQGEEDSVGAGLSVTMIPLKEDETFGSLRCCGDSVLLETDAEEIDAEETDDTETDGVETDDAETIFIQRYYYAKAGADFPEEAFCSFDYSQRYVYDFTAGEDGTAYFLLAETAEDPEEEDFVKLLEVSADGSERTLAELDNLRQTSGTAGLSDWRIRAVPGGEVLLLSRFGYRLISRDGELVEEEDWEEPRDIDVLYTGGNYALTLQSENFRNVPGTLNRENGRFGTLKDISGEARFNRTGQAENAVFMYTETGASLCDLSTGSCTKIYEWTDIGVQGDSVIGMYGDGEAPRFIFREENILYEAQWDGGSPGAEREELLLGFVSDSATTRKAVAAYNRTHPDVLIRMVDYGKEDESAAADRLYVELMAGKGPDIIQMDGGYMDDRDMGARGILEDLSPYLERSEVVSAEKLIPSVYHALLSEGRLYMLPTNFHLGGFIAKEKWASEGAAWTVEELLRILEEESGLRDGMISKNHMLECCVIAMLGAGDMDFIPEEDLLKKYICLADYMPETAVYVADDSLRRDGKLLFEQLVMMDPETYLYNKSRWGEDSAFVGYPGGAGNGMVFYPDNCYAVCAQSSHKDAAWGFVESFFTKSWQDGITPNYAFSIDRDVFEGQMKDAEKVQWYTDRSGRRQEAPIMSYEMGGEQVDVYAARPEDTDSLRKLVEGAATVKRGDMSILRIMQEEAAYYFAGQKSLEEVLDIIQNRIRLLKEERK